MCLRKKNTVNIVWGALTNSALVRLNTVWPVLNGAEWTLFIPGHGKLNQLGGVFVNGKPLPNSVRQQIIEMAERGIRPCDISRQLKVSHGCISKLLSKYNDTGSFEPGRAQRKTSRDVSSEVKNKIEEYRRTTPGIFSWEVKEKLVADGFCTKENLPPLTVISRMLRRARSTGSDLERSEAEMSDVESEGDTSSTNSGETEKAKPLRPKRRSFSIANILCINEETRTVSESSSSPVFKSKEPGKKIICFSKLYLNFAPARCTFLFLHRDNYLLILWNEFRQRLRTHKRSQGFLFFIFYSEL